MHGVFPRYRSESDQKTKRTNSLGRRQQRITAGNLERVAGLSVREAAKTLGVPPSRVYRERIRGQLMTARTYTSTGL